jgi:DnaK suppressor protein
MRPDPQSPTSEPLPARAWLEARIQALQGEIKDKLRDAAQVSDDLGHHGDSGDASVADDQATTDFSDARRDLDELHACEDALRRIASGHFGLCIDCKSPIDPRRLEHQPSVARCLACQERLERSQAFRPHTV